MVLRSLSLNLQLKPIRHFTLKTEKKKPLSFLLEIDLGILFKQEVKEVL